SYRDGHDSKAGYPSLGVSLAVHPYCRALQSKLFSFNEYLECIFGLLFQLLQQVNECDSKMQVLHVISCVIERVSIQIRPYVGCLVQYLPLLWKQSEEHNMLRCAILTTLIHLVQGLGAESRNLYPFLLPVIQLSTDVSQPPHVYLLEDGLELWLVTLENSPAVTPELLRIFQNMSALLGESSLSKVQVLHESAQHSTGTVQVQHRDSPGTVQLQHRDSPVTTQGQSRDSPGTAQGQSRYSPVTAQGQSSYNTGTVQLQHRDSLGTVQGQSRYSTGTVQVQSSYSTGTVQVQSSYSTGTVQLRHRDSPVAAQGQSSCSSGTVQGQSSCSTGTVQVQQIQVVV
ncbi:hypothetical protein NFI96_031258, partial [Prochilodus magdalenae]